MSEFAEKLRSRTKSFAIDIIKYGQKFPKNEEAFVIKKQLFKSATSVAANYRAVCRGRSDAEFYSKLCIVVEEADETVFWLEMIQDSGINKGEENTKLQKEANELLAIFSSSKKTMNVRYNKKGKLNPKTQKS